MKIAEISWMKTLVIHPADRSTDFLCPIYEPVKNKTVITGGITKDLLRKHIQAHDRVLMMGHGSPAGLFSVGRFPDSYPYIIDDSMVDILRDKIAVYIWCHADQFVQLHSLGGFYSGMFISEVSEAIWYDFDDIYDLDIYIEESNYGFAEIVSQHITEPLDVLHRNVLREYGMLAQTNPIAMFNFKRLFLAQLEPVMFTNNVGKIL